MNNPITIPPAEGTCEVPTVFPVDPAQKTLRDEFAMEAIDRLLEPDLCFEGLVQNDAPTAPKVAHAAYLLADAMMAERDRIVPPKLTDEENEQQGEGIAGETAKTPHPPERRFL